MASGMALAMTPAVPPQEDVMDIDIDMDVDDADHAVPDEMIQVWPMRNYHSEILTVNLGGRRNNKLCARRCWREH